MLGIKACNSGAARRLCKFVQRSVAFAQRDEMLLGGRHGKKFAEAPHSTKIESCMRGTPLKPNGLQRRSIDPGRLPARIRDLQQVSALRTAEILRGLARDGTTPDAAETKCDLRQRGHRNFLRSGDRRHGIGGYFEPRKY